MGPLASAWAGKGAARCCCCKHAGGPRHLWPPSPWPPLLISYGPLHVEPLGPPKSAHDLLHQVQSACGRWVGRKAWHACCGEQGSSPTVVLNLVLMSAYCLACQAERPSCRTRASWALYLKSLKQCKGQDAQYRIPWLISSACLACLHSIRQLHARSQPVRVCRHSQSPSNQSRTTCGPLTCRFPSPARANYLLACTGTPAQVDAASVLGWPNTPCTSAINCPIGHFSNACQCERIHGSPLSPKQCSASSVAPARNFLLLWKQKGRHSAAHHLGIVHSPKYNR